jgi:hypothetical protein
LRLLEAEGDTAVLFTNIVGQLRVLLNAYDAEEPRFQAVRAAIRQATHGRSWASFHDRVSGGIEPELAAPVYVDARLTDTEVVQRFFPALERAAVRKDGDGELLDHLSSGFFPPERPHAYFEWTLMPGVFHLIEATCGVRQ